LEILTGWGSSGRRDHSRRNGSTLNAFSIKGTGSKNVTINFIVISNQRDQRVCVFISAGSDVVWDARQNVKRIQLPGAAAVATAASAALVLGTNASNGLSAEVAVVVAVAAVVVAAAVVASE
jgi:hypothetical protein